MSNLYKKAAERKKVVPGGAGKPQDAQNEEAAVTTPEEPETAQAAPEAPVAEPIFEPVEETTAEPDPAPVRLILEDLIPKKKKPKRGTYGFYLDSDVHDELVKIAKQSKANKSEVLNTLLRRVLFDE